VSRIESCLRSNSGKNVLAIQGLVVSFLLAWSSSVVGAPQGARPNVVLIYADDLGWGDVGYHGVDDILTPNIDRLAADGAYFTQGYVSASVCGPSRCGLMTGVYQQRLGCGENPNTQGFPANPAFPYAGLPTRQPILSEMLQSLGYQCGMVGKWHLGLHETMRPNARGFDFFYGFLNGAHDYERAFPRFGKNKGLWPLFRNDKMLPAYSGYLTDTFSDEAVKFIQREKEKPFFLYLAYNAVHHPWQVPKKYLERTKDVSEVEDRRFFAAMVLAMDDGIGRIMAALDDAGVGQKTLVFFISDNGTPRGQGLDHPPKDLQKERGGCTMSNAGPFRGYKGDTFEGGIRVPFVMRWPGKIKAGSRYELPVINLDIAPTVLTRLGIKQPPRGLPFDGVDLMPYLNGDQGDQRPHNVLYWRRDDDYAIRKGDWKLAWNNHSCSPNSDAMLFNLTDDPAEQHDLSAERPEMKRQLQDEFDAWDSRLPPSHCWGPPKNRKPNPDVSSAAGAGRDASAPSGVDHQAIVLPARNAKLHGQALQQSSDVISHWREPQEWIEWSFESASSGEHELIVEYAGPRPTTAIIESDGQRLTANLPGRRDWGDFGNFAVGRLRLTVGQRHVLAMKAGQPWHAVNVRRILVRPLFPPSTAKPPTNRPNIVLIMADDCGYECLGAYGCLSYKTPVLDRLASEGLKFNNCHAQPLCTPSRVQIMTGRYNHRNYTGFGVLDSAEVTFGNALREAGYATCIAGKWQLDFASGRQSATTPDHFGFDEYLLWFLYDHTKRKQGRRYWEPFSFIQNGKIKEVAQKAYGPDLFCRYIVDFIGRNSRHDKPFFIYYPMALTHAPFVPTPDSPEGSFQGYRQGQYRDGVFMKDMVQYMDKTVGRIVTALDTNGVRENTLLLFTSDNGTDSHITTQTKAGLVRGGKGLMTDAGTHVPLVASWPRQDYERHECDDLVDFSDFLPTLAEAAGAPMPTGRVTDGVSFLPQLRGQRGNPRPWIFCHYWGSGRRKQDTQESVRDARWKLYDDGRFFDLDSDIEEFSPRQDLDRDAAEARQRLQRALDEVRSTR
jgi:arylsulfatase A-like enzyme